MARRKAVAAAPACGQQIGQMAHYQDRSPTKSNNSEAVGALFQSPKRQSEYGHRAGLPDRVVTASSMPILVGAALIAAAILLSTLVKAVGTRFIGMESPTEETVWLIDRLTGSVYKCQAPDRGKAACDADLATGSIGARVKP